MSYRRLPSVLLHSPALRYRLSAVLLFNAVFLLGLLVMRRDESSRMTWSNFMQITGPTLAVLFCTPFRWRNPATIVDQQRNPWERWSPILLWLSTVAFVVGQMLWAFFEVVVQQPLTAPSVADLAFISCYPLALLGVLFMPGSSLSQAMRMRVLLDGLMVLIVATTFSWYFILGPLALTGEGLSLGQFVLLLYPLGDIVMVTCTLLLFDKLNTKANRGVASLLIIALTAIIASDTVFGIGVLDGTYRTGAFSDVGWAFGNMLAPLAAWLYVEQRRLGHLSSSTPALAQPAKNISGRGLLPYLLLPAVGALLLYTMDTPGDEQFQIGVLVGATVFVFLIVVRQVLTLNENDRLYHALQTAYVQLEQQNEANRVATHQLRHVIESAPVPMAMFDRDMHYLAYSQKWLVDHDRVGENLLGRIHYEVFPDAPERLRETHHRALRGETLSMIEDHIAYGEHSHHWRWAITPWYEQPNEIGGVILCSNIVDDLVAARETALETARLKSEFLATMSHEIRTPMNALIGMSELLIATDLNNDQREYANIVLDSGQGLLRIINDILDFSKIEAGKLALEDGDVDIRATVESVTDMFAKQARQKDLSLMTFVAPNVPVLLGGDAGRLRQILMNLVGNAVKFTEAGHITLSVTREAATTAQTALRFTVEDTGIGLGEAACRSLFEPFTQADGSITRRFGGTGLGLAISRRLTELMGGTIEVRSTEGKGSTFSFTAWFIPRPEAARATDRDGVSALRHRRLLVVDDLPASSSILGAYAEEWGMRCEVVADGRAALRTLLSTPPDDRFDVAIIDYAMPGMDGLALGRAIQSEPTLAGLHMILLTAFDERHLTERALANGFGAYLNKPVHLTALETTLERMVAGTETTLQDDPRIVESPLASPVAETVGGIERILVVEDNPINRKLALAQLKRLGYDALAVDNGREAVEALAQQPQAYSLVLMDCQMPVMDGYTATQTIRCMEAGSAQHIPIIAMTADVIEGTREECLRAGMDDYISKPVRVEALRGLLAAWRPTLVDV